MQRGIQRKERIEQERNAKKIEQASTASINHTLAHSSATTIDESVAVRYVSKVIACMQTSLNHSRTYTREHDRFASSTYELRWLQQRRRETHEAMQSCLR